MISNKDKLKIPFTKGHANGNDFIFIFKKDINKKHITQKLITNICDRHTGVGADGLFIISESKKEDFLLDYYNADGSWETLCANGSRCAVLLMKENKKIKNSCSFITGAGTHSASILKNNLIKMSMQTPIYKSQLISPEGQDGYFVDSGAKHFVCHYPKINNTKALKIGKKIRHSKMFAPNGVNVNFFNMKNENEINILTYEKGVESIMRSCASGSTAVVFHLAQTMHLKKKVTTFSPGGSLQFSFNNNWSSVHIVGNAQLICFGNFFADKKCFS